MRQREVTAVPEESFQRAEGVICERLEAGPEAIWRLIGARKVFASSTMQGSMGSRAALEPY